MSVPAQSRHPRPLFAAAVALALAAPALRPAAARAENAAPAAARAGNAPPAAARAESAAPAAVAAPAGARAYPLEAGRFTVLARESGPRNYYRTVADPVQPFIRGVYRPGLETVTLFTEMPEELRRGVRLLRWRWRALVLPREGNECEGGTRADSAANVYVTWKSGLRWYSLKFVWSTEARLGATCAGKRNPLVAQDSIVLRSGGPVGVWQDEAIEPDRLFREHFESGDPNAEVPELAGIGIMTDGDQTHSVSAADFTGFVLYK